ncbi:MAG: hypothetical protein KGJ34_03020 [Patescibacteria group bacterium]|nr:hypothetical protein [Patescibacteria group bacterium]
MKDKSVLGQIQEALALMKPAEYIAPPDERTDSDVVIGTANDYIRRLYTLLIRTNTASECCRKALDELQEELSKEAVVEDFFEYDDWRKLSRKYFSAEQYRQTVESLFYSESYRAVPELNDYEDPLLTSSWAWVVSDEVEIECTLESSQEEPLGGRAAYDGSTLH